MATRRRQKDQEEDDVAQLKLGPDFTDATTLLNSEVAILLEHKKEYGERDAELPIMFQKTLDYSQRFSRHKNKQTVREIKGALEQRGLAPYDVASLGNLCPESVEEAKALIPSLARFSNDDLQAAINDLASFKRFE